MAEKVIEVSGLGVVSFPDSMSDEQINSAIQAQLGASNPITSKPKNDSQWNQLKQQHGLPASYDLSKTLVENYGNLSKDEINSIDLNKLQQAYSIANPREARKPGFFSNMLGEAADIIRGLTEKPGATAGVAGSPAVGPTIEAAKDNPINVVPVVGPMAVQRGRQVAAGDISGAMGAGVTDLAALLAPVAIGKVLNEVPEGASPKTLSDKLGRALYDPETGKIQDLKKAATDAIVRKLVKDPYEVERNAARVGKTFDEYFDEFQKSNQESHDLFSDRLAEAEKARKQELSQFGRLRTVEEREQAKASKPVAPDVFNLSESSGPYRGPASVPKPVAPKPAPSNPFGGTATSTTPAQTSTMAAKPLPTLPGTLETPPQAAPTRTTPFPARFVSEWEKPETASPEVSEAAQDLISRNTRVVQPGEMPSAADLKRAGDYTQIPALKLKALKKFGDRLAAIELTRRGIND